VAQFYTVRASIRTEITILVDELKNARVTQAADCIDMMLPIWEKAAANARVLVDDFLDLSGVEPKT
jgi:hypothetical protein